MTADVVELVRRVEALTKRVDALSVVASAARTLMVTRDEDEAEFARSELRDALESCVTPSPELIALMGRRPLDDGSGDR